MGQRATLWREAVERRARPLWRSTPSKRSRRALRHVPVIRRLPGVRRRPRPGDAEGDGQERVESRATRIDEHLVQHVVRVRLFTRTFPTSNVWILHDGDEAVLIDAGFGDDSSVGERLAYLERELGELRVHTIAITHHHSDHSSGGRRLSERLGAEIAMNPLDEVLLHTPQEGNEDLPDDRELSERARLWRQEALATEVHRPLADGESFSVGGLTVRAVHTPGHTAGHTCYLVEETGVLFTGDTILGVGTSAISPPPAGDMGQYLESLERIGSLGASLLAPGHGPVVRDPTAKVRELLDHRHGRDRQILDLIDRGYSSDRQIRRALYPEIQSGLRRAARGQVRAHLARLGEVGTLRVEPGEREWRVERPGAGTGA